MESFETLKTFVQPIVLTISFVYFYGFFARWRQKEESHQILMGILFSFAVIITMSDPVALNGGVLVDMRTLFLGLAAGLFGWLAGLIALSVGIMMRLSAGGDATMVGVTSMCLATGLALLWRYRIRRRIRSQIAGLTVLGLLVSFHHILAFTLPPDVRNTMLFEIGPILTLSTVLGAVLLGVMINREELLLTETTALRTAAHTDDLTQLMNRRRLREVFQQLRPAESALKGRAVIIFDIDHFKTINDTYGHSTGDDVLRVISERVGTCLRPDDLFARLGGDEFVVVLPQIWQSGARHVAERCRQSISTMPIIAGGQSLDVTVSIGVHWTTGAPDFKSELALADTALYQAKNRGRNCVAYRPQPQLRFKPLEPAA